MGPTFLTRAIVFLITLALSAGSALGQTVESEGPAGSGPLSLTAAEKTWLAAHPRVRIGIDGGYAPYSFLDSDGGFIGIAPDFVDAIGEMTGLSFEALPDLSWPEILDGARRQDLDVIATAVRTPERRAFLDFTQIYLPTPLVVMTRKEDERVAATEDIDGLTIALVEGYASSARVLGEHPRVIPRYAATPLEGLQAVAVGEADATSACWASTPT